MDSFNSFHGDKDSGSSTADSAANVFALNVKDSVHLSKTDQTYASKGITSIVLPARKDTVIALPKEEENPKHTLIGVSDYCVCLPDSQPMHLAAAMRLGVSDVPRDRAAIDSLKDQVVCVAPSPYYVIASNMTSSVPYLVPEASDLLERISRNFMDSCSVKKLPMHRLVVSSIWRTESDVSKLQRGNKNATTRSCHMFGTTFDINYNRYEAVETAYGPRWSRSACFKLKSVLAEVLRDLRDQGYCYVKYEGRQPCFHITVR